MHKHFSSGIAACSAFVNGTGCQIVISQLLLRTCVVFCRFNADAANAESRFVRACCCFVLSGCYAQERALIAPNLAEVNVLRR